MMISRRAEVMLAASVAVAALLACGNGSGSAASEVAVDVRPAAAQVAPGGSLTFAALTTGTADSGVDWTVEDGTVGGSIDASGLYTAPAAAGTYTVVATSRADRSKNGTSHVTVTSAESLPDCATTGLRGTGTVHYFCPSGSDSNNGLSPTSPKASWSAISSAIAAMSAGDTVALCRTGSWSASPVSISKRCSSGTSTCDIRDYGTGNRPILSYSSSSQPFYLNGASWVRLWNLDIRESASPDGNIAIFGDSRNLDICNNAITGGYLGINQGPSGTDNLNITIRNNQISNMAFSGFYGGGANSTITGNVFTNNGLNSSPQMHSAYIIAHSKSPCSTCESGAPYDGDPGTLPVVFSNNSVDEGSYCAGPLLVQHGEFFNTALVMENNNFSTSSTNGNCFGAMVSTGNSGSHFQNDLIRRNRFSGTGNMTGINVECCSNCTISDNIVTGGTISYGSGGSSSCTSGGAPSGGMIVNNSIYLPSNSQGAYPLCVAGSGHTVENNAVWTGWSSCYSISGATHYDKANNYCRAGSGVSVGNVWVNAPNGDFTPVNPGPLVGTGNSTYYSPTAIGSVSWSPSDTGVARATPISMGAIK